MQRPLWKRVLYFVLQRILLLGGVIFFRIRIRGIQHEPASGPVLVVANHQSHLDPPMIGAFFKRRSNYLARDTLFRFFPLGWLLGNVGAIPLDREGGGLGGMKETLRRLKHGEMVLVFPEGSRTRDGEVAELKPGFCALARRSGVQLLPVGIGGAFEAWPRTRLLPKAAPVQIEVGPPIPPEQIARWSNTELIAEVRSRLQDCHARATAGCLRADG